MPTDDKQPRAPLASRDATADQEDAKPRSREEVQEASARNVPDLRLLRRHAPLKSIKRDQLEEIAAEVQDGKLITANPVNSIAEWIVVGP